MTFNLAMENAQLLSRLCIQCNVYHIYILDSFSKKNGHYMVRRLHGKECVSVLVLFCAQLTFDLILRPRDFPDLASTPIGFTTHVGT